VSAVAMGTRSFASSSAWGGDSASAEVATGRGRAPAMSTSAEAIACAVAGIVAGGALAATSTFPSIAANVRRTSEMWPHLSPTNLVENGCYCSRASDRGQSAFVGSVCVLDISVGCVMDKLPHRRADESEHWAECSSVHAEDVRTDAQNATRT
jgi:hypothetical protein